MKDYEMCAACHGYINMKRSSHIIVNMHSGYELHLHDGVCNEIFQEDFREDIKTVTKEKVEWKT